MHVYSNAFLELMINVLTFKDKLLNHKVFIIKPEKSNNSVFYMYIENRHAARATNKLG